MSTKVRVWSKFMVNCKNNGPLRLRVQDAPGYCVEDLADFIKDYYGREELLHKVAGVYKNKEALEECKQYHKNYMKKSRNIICCTDNGTERIGEIVGVSTMMHRKGDDPEDNYLDISTKTKEMRLAFQLMDSTYSRFNARKELKLNSIYEDGGAAVHPDYRGLGIAHKLYQAWYMVCKADGVPAVCAWASAVATQKSAERQGWKTVFEVPYKQIGHNFGIQINEGPAVCKFVVLRVK